MKKTVVALVATLAAAHANADSQRTLDSCYDNGIYPVAMISHDNEGGDHIVASLSKDEAPDRRAACACIEAATRVKMHEAEAEAQRSYRSFRATERYNSGCYEEYGEYYFKLYWNRGTF